MKCYDCGGEFKKKSGTLELHDNKIGNYLIEHADYYKCNKCGELMFRGSTLRTIEAKEDEIRDRLIKKLPIDEFIGATEVARILEISRQAIHKHPRIRRGFIYSIDHEGRKLYHKKSVELYLRTGDGRFPLLEQEKAPEVKFVIINQSAAPGAGVFEEVLGEAELHHWFKNDNYFLGIKNAE